MSNPTELLDLDLPATTEAAREYLVEWHRENLTAAPYFTDYISKTLAGDFAYHLARWLARRAQPKISVPKADLRSAWDKYKGDAELSDDDAFRFAAGYAAGVHAQPQGEAPQAWEWAPSLKVADDEVMFFSQIYQTASGLPVMTDSSEHSTWNVATVFKRPTDGVDSRNPVRILTVDAPAAQHADSGAQADGLDDTFIAEAARNVYGIMPTSANTIAVGRAVLAAYRAALAAQSQGAEAPTDEEIIAAVHACGVDTHPSKYDLPALQVGATSVPVIRNIYMKLATRAALAAKAEAPDDPLDMPLPCDIKVGAGTMRKGVKLRTLVARMEGLHRMAMEAHPEPTPEQRAELEKFFPPAAQQAAAPAICVEFGHTCDCSTECAQPNALHAESGARAAFQKWCVEIGSYWPDRFYDDGRFAEANTRQAFGVWSAAWNAGLAAQSQGAPCRACHGVGTYIGQNDGYDDADCSECDGSGKAKVAAPSAPGTPEAPQPPFPVSDDEMAALRRFWECASDGEGYDVEKTMMQRLAEMGLVQRKSGAYYMVTEFGLYVLREYTMPRAAQLDGGQEGSESNG